jgi:hypothetical protein
MKIIGLWLKLLTSSFFIAILTHAFSQALIPGILMGGIGAVGWIFFINWFNKILAQDNYVARTFAQSAILAGLATGVYLIFEKNFTLWLWGALFVALGFWVWRFYDLSGGIEKTEKAQEEQKLQKQKKAGQEKSKVVEINFM